jgi:hypothetical protein
MATKRYLTGVFLFFACVVNAQTKSHLKTDAESFFRLGIKGGVNINKISGVSYNDGFRFNYQLGGFVQFNFSNRFGLQPEINFVQSSAEFTNDVSDVYNDIFRDGDKIKGKLSYLEIPILLNVNVGESKHVKLQLGPSFGAVVQQTVDSLKNGNIGKLYKNGEWSVLAGVWIQLPLVHFGARYKLGLSNINANIIDATKEWKNQAIQIFIGLTF